ncbi:MAG: hypothetical protein FJ090_03270 [Deltaproteobacteria bacterium]|nr:hypothetical protein [Deltaproteobacteria bacterium]
MDAAALAARWAEVAAQVEQIAENPPPSLPRAVFDEAAAGRVGRISGADSAVGVGLMRVPQALVWLSLTDDRLSEDVEGLTEIALEGRWSSPKLLYQRLDMPWPVQDRHWVLRLRNNTALAMSTGVWERAWRIDNARLAESRGRTDPVAFDGAITMADNTGSWLLVSLDTSDTLAVYQVRVDLGGNIPAEAAEAYTRSSMASFMRGVEVHAADVAARYGAGCTPQLGGDGKPIPCLP